MFVARYHAVYDRVVMVLDLDNALIYKDFLRETRAFLSMVF